MTHLLAGGLCYAKKLPKNLQLTTIQWETLMNLTNQSKFAKLEPINVAQISAFIKIFMHNVDQHYVCITVLLSGERKFIITILNVI